MSSNAPIGVFDSGIGGMTIVKELMSQLPAEQIIYYGDTARVPYGNKSADTIINYSRQIADFLVNQGVKALVVACNTISAIALETLRSEFDLPIIGVVKPGAKAAADATKNGRIGVIATRATVNSGIYEDFLHKTNPDIKVYKQACPLFVPLVEEGWIDDPITDKIIHRYLDGLVNHGIDSLVLGCTHYPLLRERIQLAVGDGITLVNPAYETAKAFKYVLEENNLLHENSENSSDAAEAPAHEFYVSDSTAQFLEFANTLLADAPISADSVHVKSFD